MRYSVLNLSRGLAVVSLVAALAACEPAQEATSPANAPVAPAGAATKSATALPLPLPINAVMVSMVDFAADGIWRPAAQDTPMTDAQWRLAEKDATDLIASATLITTAGTGMNDAAWVEDADWSRWSFEMQQLAIAARDAVDRKDQGALKTAGDQLVEVCQACHQKFKPGLPSMGLTRFPTYPKYPEPETGAQ
jgi:cytochrome c5